MRIKLNAEQTRKMYMCMLPDIIEHIRKEKREKTFPQFQGKVAKGKNEALSKAE